ncbi:MAG TPA: hypothetical protein VGM59_09260 [Dongiaceae bacterium]|jgi:hypothetical protein
MIFWHDEMEERMTAISKARFLLSAVAMLGVLSVTEAVKADPIPQAWLQAQHDACMKSCGTFKAGDGVCTRYCGCIGLQTSSSMTMEEYMELDQAMKDGKPLPQEPGDKMQGITKTCLARAK